MEPPKAIQPNQRITTKNDGDARAVGIACRLDSPESIEIVQLISTYLLDRKERVFFETRISSKFIRHFAKNLEEMDQSNTKFVIAVGGDGTVLRIAQNLPKKDPPPIFGINMGSVGFLDESSSDPSVLKQDLDRVFAGEYHVERCSRLMVIIDQYKPPLALNEVVIMSSKPSKVLYANIAIDGINFTSSYLDGLIISTHTGSTAYALSAGGCLLDPRLDGFEIVPLNPFAGTGVFRPLVVPTSAEIQIRLLRPRLNGLIIIDGQTELKVNPQSTIKIRRAESDIYFIRFKEQLTGYFEKVRDKILFSRKLIDDSLED